MPRTSKSDLTAKLSLYKEDFPLYAKEVLFIKTKDRQLAPFVLNRAQRRWWGMIQEDRRAGKPIRHYLLKSRQLGFTTMTAGLSYHSTTLNPNTNALLVAHEIEQAGYIHDMGRVFYQMSPEHLRPMQRLSNRRELYFANADPKGDVGLESRIVIQTADNANLGIGKTLHFIHLSEFARYQSIQKDIAATMAGMKQTIPDLPETYVIIETTAQGLGYAKDFWDDRNNGYRKIFVSWIAGDDYRSDIPLDRKEVCSISETVYGNEEFYIPFIEKELLQWYPELGSDRELLNREILCRLRWRRHMIDTRLEGRKELFSQEYPTYPEEAFLTTGVSVFDTRKLYDIKQASKQIEHKTYRYNQGTGLIEPAVYGPIKIYDEPIKHRRYVVGVDVSEGFSEKDDKSAIQVLELPHLRQVCTYKDTIDPLALAYVVDAIGRKYNTAPVAVETNGPGFATNLELWKNIYYPSLYIREVFDSFTGQYLTKYGFHANKLTKQMLLSDLRALIRDDMMVLRDTDTLDEMSWYVQHGTGKIGAMYGKNDDLVSALMLAVQMALQVGVGDRNIHSEEILRPGSIMWHHQNNRSGKYRRDNDQSSTWVA